MGKCTGQTQIIKEENSWSVLEQVAREGARKMLQLALENEVGEFIAKYSNTADGELKESRDKKRLYEVKRYCNRNGSA